MENGGQIFYTKQPFEAGKLFTVLQAGRIRTTSMQRMHHGPENGYRLEYMLQGTGYVSTEGDGSMIQVTAGQLLCIRQGCGAVIWSDREEPGERIWFRLEGSFADALFSLYRIPDVYAAASPALPECLALAELLAGGKEDPATCGETAALLSAILVKTMAPVLFPDERQEVSVSRRMQAYIDSHLYEDLHLDGLAVQFGYAKMHLIRLFRDEIGITPMQYVLRQRMDAACKMLTGTVMPVAEIAGMLHYSSAQHFTAAFRKHTGVTPAVYRKEQGITEKTKTAEADV